MGLLMFGDIFNCCIEALRLGREVTVLRRLSLQDLDALKDLELCNKPAEFVELSGHRQLHYGLTKAC